MPSSVKAGILNSTGTWSQKLWGQCRCIDFRWTLHQSACRRARCCHGSPSYSGKVRRLWSSRKQYTAIWSCANVVQGGSVGSRVRRSSISIRLMCQGASVRMGIALCSMLLCVMCVYVMRNVYYEQRCCIGICICIFIYVEVSRGFFRTSKFVCLLYVVCCMLFCILYFVMHIN